MPLNLDWFRTDCDWIVKVEIESGLIMLELQKLKLNQNIFFKIMIDL